MERGAFLPKTLCTFWLKGDLSVAGEAVGGWHGFRSMCGKEMIRCDGTTCTSFSEWLLAASHAAASQHHAVPDQDACHLRSETRPCQSLCRQPCVATWTPGMLSDPARPQLTIWWCIALHGSPCAWHLSTAKSDPSHVTVLVFRSHKISSGRRRHIDIRGSRAVVSSMRSVTSAISTIHLALPQSRLAKPAPHIRLSKLCRFHWPILIAANSSPAQIDER